MKYKPLLILLFTSNTLIESPLLYANEIPQLELKQTKSSLFFHPSIPRSMKQIYQDENGTWFLSKHKGKKGGCAVSYSSDLNQFTLFGPSNKNLGSFAFTGPFIPTTRNNQQVNIIMRTDKVETPTKATLVHSHKKNVLLVPVAMEQAAPHIEDTGTMEILFEGKTIYASWISGGFKARDALVSCIKS